MSLTVSERFTSRRSRRESSSSPMSAMARAMATSPSASKARAFAEFCDSNHVEDITVMTLWSDRHWLMDYFRACGFEPGDEEDLMPMRSTPRRVLEALGPLP